MLSELKLSCINSLTTSLSQIRLTSAIYFTLMSNLPIKYERNEVFATQSEEL